ncbi:hypothetical protein AB6N24_17905 [Cellulomonas sp. 179-A 4D5 NHS]|uniref:hypothetical protein n=1 Tax=Cellulomonas sp. 179-A 4D5 NHS TaxID=3142378 RepID=UPI0039A337D4
MLYAAELANYVRRLAWERAGTLHAGLRKLAEETGLNHSTLRFVADGERWTTLRLVAQLEVRTGDRATGWDLVIGRVMRGTSAHPAQRPARDNRSAVRTEPDRNEE